MENVDKNKKNFDCIICTSKNPDEKGICILHITEAISYYPNDQRVDILFDIIMCNHNDEPRQCRIAHPGKTTAFIKKYESTDEGDKRREIITKLFSKRIKENDQNEDTLKFHKRINCVGIDEKYTEVSKIGPKGYFEDMNIKLLTPEINDDRECYAFTSYLLPEITKEEGTVIFTIQLEFKEESYRKLIGDGSNISVESYVYLKSDLQRYVLPDEENEEIKKLYEEKIQPDSSIIVPKEYDIVIFPNIGQKVNVSFESISAPQMVNESVRPNEAICFLGKPREFCLRFSYPDEVVAEQRKKIQQIEDEKYNTIKS